MHQQPQGIYPQGIYPITATPTRAPAPPEPVVVPDFPEEYKGAPAEDFTEPEPEPVPDFPEDYMAAPGASDSLGGEQPDFPATDDTGPFTGEHDEDGFRIMKPMHQQPQGIYPVVATPASAPASPTATAPPTTPPPCATPPCAPQKEAARKKRGGRGMRKLFKKLFSKCKPSRTKSNTRTPCSRSEDEAWHQMVCLHQKQGKGKTRARQDGKGKGLALMNSKAGGRLKCWSKGK